MIPDELHESLGYTRVSIGIAPQRDTPQPSAKVVQDTVVTVQWFDLWEQMIDPAQQVNPIPITKKAERLRLAINAISSAEFNDQVWYLLVENIEYPRDPTGNKTRFVATIRAIGRNSSLAPETGG